jgi:hypothetical protein
VTRFTAHHRFARAELDWLAFDRRKRVAIFSTAGVGPIPDSLNVETSVDVSALILSGEPRCEARCVSEPGGNHSEWDELARRGVFAYDWIRQESAYLLIAKPAAIIDPSAAILGAISVSLDVEFDQLARFAP